MNCPGISLIDPRCQIAAAATDAFSSMARSFATAAAGAVTWLWTQLDDATAVDLESRGVQRDLLATGAIAVILCLGLFLVQVITATLRREPAGLVRAVTGLGIALVASTFAIAATGLLLAAVDQLSAGVVQYATGTNINGLGTRFALAQSLAQISNPAGLFLFAIIILAAVVVVWGALMMRKLLIIVAAVMTPLAFAGGAADISRGWVRRWIEFTAALIAAKLLLVVMLMVGLSVFQGAGLATGTGEQATATQAGTQLATGSVLLLMAGFAPWIAIRMFHFAGDTLHAAHMQAAAARTATQSVVAAPRKVNSAMMTTRSLGAVAGVSSSPTRTSTSGQDTTGGSGAVRRPDTANPETAAGMPTGAAAAAAMPLVTTHFGTTAANQVGQVVPEFHQQPRGTQPRRGPQAPPGTGGGSGQPPPTPPRNT
jgi:hypothetical protein